jgi:hypothetical protein
MGQVKVVTKPPRLRKYQVIVDQIAKLKNDKALEVFVKGWSDERRNRFKVGLRVEARRRKLKIQLFTRENRVYIYR